MMLRCGDSVGKNGMVGSLIFSLDMICCVGCTERTSIIHTLLQNYDFH